MSYVVFVSLLLAENMFALAASRRLFDIEVFECQYNC